MKEHTKPRESKIEVVGGPGKGKAIKFKVGQRIVVGRADDATFSIPADKHMSRHHFAVEADANGVELIDLGSANGTLIQGRRIDGRFRVGDGDVFVAGHSRFRIHDHGSRAREAERARGSAKMQCRQCGQPVSLDQVTIVVEPQSSSDIVWEDSVICRACQVPIDYVEPVLPSFPGYDTVDLLGEGNMGAVYLVRRAHDEQYFALKCMRTETEVRPDHVKRFFREAESLSSLKHANIVGYVDQGYAYGDFFFVMEYVEGVNLDVYRRQAGGCVSVDRCVSLMCSVLEALDYAHNKGFVHRDIKPANILVGVQSGRMVPKLTDFGLAKSVRAAGLDQITKAHVSLGTPDYMPPEQITQFRDFDPRGDLYAVGATLYHLLSGSTLFEGVEGDDPVRILLDHKPVPLSQRAPHLSASVSRVVDRALLRNPVERWNSARVFRDQLSAAIR
jgi:pSer/pThr/pTyr-binding forkhead associated (FHA) protein